MTDKKIIIEILEKYGFDADLANEVSKEIIKETKHTKLRDKFAGQALVGMLARPNDGFPTTVEIFAECAYEYADAMLEER